MGSISTIRESESKLNILDSLLILPQLVGFDKPNDFREKMDSLILLQGLWSCLKQLTANHILQLNGFSEQRTR